MALSVFEGGFTRESARALSLQGRLGISLPLLAALLDKSLLSMQGGLRYALHPVVQAYASERLAEDPLAQARARDEHAACFARLLAALAPLSRTDSKRLLQGIDPELGNVRAAWQHAVATRRAEILGEMTMALGRYLEASGRFAEGAQWFRHAMTALVAATPEPPRAPWALQRLRLALALMLHRGGHQGEALAVADAGVRAGIADGDLETYLGCLGGSGSALWAQGQLAQAHERFGQALLLAREHHDRHGTGQALGNLAITHQARGENAEAVACSEEALAIARELGNHYLACVHQINLCVARGAAGDHGAAAMGWREAIAHAQVHGLHYHERHAHGGLAGALHSLGRLEEARAQAQVALEGARTSGTIDLQTWMLGLLARIEIAEARYESAMAPLRELVRVALQNGMQVDLLRSARHYAMVRAGLGHRVEAVRILRMVIAHPQTPRDNARQYGPDLEGLKLSAGEEHSVHEAPAPSLDEVLAAIEASAEPVPGGPSRRLNELPAAPA